MIVLHHLLATFVAALSGYCLLSVLRWPGLGSRSPGEQAGLSYLVGLLLIAGEIVLLEGLGLPVTFRTLLLLQLAPLSLPVLRFALSRGRWRPGFHRAPGWPLVKRWWAWILVTLLASKLLYVFVMNLTEWLRVSDAIMVSLGLAKHVFYEQTSAGYRLLPGYPRIPGLILSWFALAQGSWREAGVNLAHFNYYAVFLLLFYANLRRCVGTAEALIGAYLLSAFPLILNHAVLVGYADLALAIFLTFAGVYATRYARDGSPDDLILALFFTLCLPALKLEGKIPYLPFAIYVLLAAIGCRRGLLSPRAVWIATGGLAAAGLGLVGILEARYGYEGPPWIAAYWGNLVPGNRLAAIGEPLLAHFGHLYNHWMVLGSLTAVVFPLLTARYARREALIPGLFGTLLLGSFVYLYCVGGGYLWLVNGTAVNRSFLQILPTLLFASLVMGRSLRFPARPSSRPPALP
jgi:hypothetical protein